MHDLITIDAPELSGALTVADIAATMAYAEAEKAPGTRVAYESDWRHFSIWCLSRGATSLPAHQGLVAAYLSSLADAGQGQHYRQAAPRSPTSTNRPATIRPTASAGVRAVRREFAAPSAPRP